MTDAQIAFEDGLGYERYMGKWSQLAGRAFLDWLAPAAGLRWLDVGCGNGAFTESIFQHCAPVFVDAIDPSVAQLQFARARLAGRPVAFRRADAMALPYRNAVMDVAAMPLVIFFLDEPARGLAEMARVTGPGGVVAAYAWDMDGGGFPFQILHDEMRALGIPVPSPPSPEASRLDALDALWRGAGLEAVDTHVITVQRCFNDFDDYWTTVLLGASVVRQLRALAPGELSTLQARLRPRLPIAPDGQIRCVARAHAVRGRVAA